MKKLMLGLAVGLTAAAMFANPASAAAPSRSSLDQYGCRWESSSDDYRCYRGRMAGKTFDSQQDMMRAHAAWRMRSERLVPVYVDDDGAPRPMPPHASRGVERPPASENMAEYPLLP